MPFVDTIEISTNKDKLDIDLIFRYLNEESYWAKDRTASAVRKSIEHSICFGVYSNGQQIGFGRAVTDRAVVFYLADIFILAEYQGLGIGKRLMKFILDHKDLKGMRGILTTQTAHEFYREFGFDDKSVVVRERMMTLDGKSS